ncbi:MAG: response regulator transcription factor [Candidatus Tectomicrobia bacterium]|uniref:Response regulator transcription factor n=1 Tax=Tectimicrobiota bacterium TaxID=2528274 RepID=A0A932CRD6_UNCTE|nr:response regulator transcription factor [Candidatus Tectomicrobia bacterium]
MELGKKIEILLIDNQAASFHEPLEAILDVTSPDTEYVIRSTKDPQQSLGMIGEREIDVALLGLDLSVCGDYEANRQVEQLKDSLPGMPEEKLGYRLLRYVKREMPQAKVIILASYGMCGEEPLRETERALEAGADGLVLKPFGMRELVVEIEKVLALESSESSVS